MENTLNSTAHILALPSPVSTPTLKKRINTFLSGITGSISLPKLSVMHFSDGAVNSSGAMRGFKKNSFFFVPLGIGILIIFGALYLLFQNISNSSASTGIGSEDERVEVAKPRNTQTINKTYSFPLRDNAGKEVSKLQYTIVKADLLDEIIVKGQRARAVQGRTFLVLTVKITNDFNQSLRINARDYVRLTVEGSDEKLAPEIHNDPVEVQAISTKTTRLGFPINDDDKKLTLQVGEVKGKKENIPLTLQ